MRLIDADALMDDIKRDTKKAIDEGDKAGSFWLGYAAGSVIAQPTIQSVATDTNVGNNSEIPNSSDCISRQAVIDAVDSETVSTNPEHFKSSEKFIKFMDDDDIASFGRWQWANGFNTALVASKVQLEKLPSAQPEPKEGHWIPHETPDGGVQYECSRCGVLWEFNDGTPEDNEAYFCPHCGARMKGERQK